MKTGFVFLLTLLLLDGVFCILADEMKSVSVMEGDSVTLHTDVTDIQSYDRILWTFGPENIRIAQFNREVKKFSVYDGADGRFRDRLQLNHQNGSLTIKNTRITDSGLYQLQIIQGNEVPSKKFSINVFAHLPTPEITNVSSQCPSSSETLSKSECVLLCSVMNVTQVTLSWYKGNSLLSSISDSDLNTLSLPLEVEYQDTNTYSCVVNNTIRNQTKHLNITDLCKPCSVNQSTSSTEVGLPVVYVVLICAGVILLVVIGVAFCWIYRKNRKAGPGSGEENIELTNGDAKKDGLKSVSVMEGGSVTLGTDVTNIEGYDVIRWKFAEYRDSTSPFVPIAVVKKRNSNLINNDSKRRLGDRLHLDRQTGVLTISDMRTTDSGLYKLKIKGGKKKFTKTFMVNVSASTEHRRNESDGTNSHDKSEETPNNTSVEPL